MSFKGPGLYIGIAIVVVSCLLALACYYYRKARRRPSPSVLESIELGLPSLPQPSPPPVQYVSTLVQFFHKIP